MIQSVICRRQTIQNLRCNSHIRSPVRAEPRRNSVPPTHTLTATHPPTHTLTATHLPTPQTETAQHNTHSNKTTSKSTITSKMISKRSSLERNNLNNTMANSSSTQDTSSSSQTQNPISQSARSLTLDKEVSPQQQQQQQQTPQPFPVELKTTVEPIVEEEITKQQQESPQQQKQQQQTPQPFPVELKTTVEPIVEEEITKDAKCNTVERTIEEMSKSKRLHRKASQLKRITSRWQSKSSAVAFANGNVNGNSGNVPVASAIEKAKSNKKRWKLLGDENSLHVAVASNLRQRYITKDGKCRVNLGPIVEKIRFISDIFTTIVDLNCRWFLLVFTMCYIVTWVIFGGIYFFGAWLRDDISHVGDPKWKPCFENVDSFLSALLLSLESQRTIGYGSRMVTANCSEGVVLLMIQSILGSIIDALMVGCMFVKISRPQQRAQTLIFSKHCVICERDEKLCMLFRIGDLRASHMVDAKIRAKLIKSRQTKEGEFIPLEQSEINLGYDCGGDRLLLVEPQTITHVINEASPFWEVGSKRLKRETFEIIVILEGIVEASGMTCQARTSYTEEEVLWGHRFESCISLEKGAYRVDYSAFDKTFEVQMSLLSAKDRSNAIKQGVVL